MRRRRCLVMFRILSDLVRCCPQRAVLALLAATAVLSAPAHAQRGGRGFGRRGTPGHPETEQGIPVPKLVNPVNLLIEHRQELTLSDSQFAHVIAIKRTLDSTNAPLLRRIDSVERLFRGGFVFSEPSREHRDSVAEGRSVIQEMSAGLRDNYSQAKDHAFSLLGAQQYAKAMDIYAKAEQAIIDDEQKRKQ